MPCLCAGTVTFSNCSHPSGSILAGAEEAVNFTTVTCIFLSGDVNRTVVWSVKFDGSETSQLLPPEDGRFLQEGRLNNKLTVLKLLSELDGAIVYCGIEESPELFNFTLRVYRKFVCIMLC